MEKIKKIRIFWLKMMYVSTLVIAGGLGVGLLIFRDATQWIFGIVCSHILSGLIGSMFLAFALLSVLGLRNPVRFVPLLCLQLLYKLIWICFIAIPLFFTGEIAIDMIVVIIVFLAVIIGDMIAIPFHILFEGKQK